MYIFKRLLRIIGVVLIVFGLLVAFFVFYRASNTPERKTANLSQVAKYKDGESLEEFIQGKTWSSYIATGPNSEGTEWTFHADGTFKNTFISDYTDGFSGQWSIVELGKGQGLLYMTYIKKPFNERVDPPKNIRSISYVQATENTLQFNFSPLWGRESDNNSTIQNKSNNISVQALKNAFPEYELLLGKTWIKETEKGKFYIPHELTFYENGTFYAKYNRSKPCDFYGRWAVSSVDASKISLLLSAPESHCDERGYSGYGMGSGHIFTITQNKLTNIDYSDENYSR